MNMLKRSFAMLLALCMLVSAVPVNAFAAEATDLTEPIVLETDAPEVTEAPIESETPTESEVPTESEIPTEGETIGEEEDPTEGVTIPEEETVPEETVPEETEEFFEIGWVSEEEISGVTMGTKPADGTTTGEPFPQGAGESNSFRIPALVTLSDGTLVAAADARWNSTLDNGGIDTIVSVSTNNGSTWNYSYANYLGDNGNGYNNLSTCFIDPALIAQGNTVYMLVDLYPHGVAIAGTSDHRAETTVTGFGTTSGEKNYGKLLLSGNQHTSYDYYLDGSKIYASDGTVVDGYTVDAYFNITDSDGATTNLFFSDSPYQVQRTGYLYLTKGTWDGTDLTWSTPTLLNLKKNSEMSCLVGPGRGLVTSNGWFVFPVYSYTDAAEYTSLVYSTDGQVWNRSSSLTSIDSSEAAVVELPNGQLRVFFRNHESCLCYADYNFNGGWGGVTKTTVPVNSNTQLSAITYSQKVDGQNVILVSCPTGPNAAGSNSSDGSNRLNGRIFGFALDDSNNMTLLGSVVVNETNNSEFMYSCLTELKDGSVGLLYEDHQNGWGGGSSSYYFTLEYDAFTEAQLETAYNVTFGETSGGDTENTNEVNVSLKVGETVTQTIEGVALNNGNNTDTSVATVTWTGTTTEGGTTEKLTAVTLPTSTGSVQCYISDGNGNYLSNNGTTLTNATSVEEATKWTITYVDTPAWDTNTNNMSRYNVSATINGYTYYVLNNSGLSLNWSNASNANHWHTAENGFFGGMAGTSGWNFDGTSWTVNSSGYGNANVYDVETVTGEATSSTTVTITGNAVGTTSVEVGTTTYNITVVPEGITNVVDIELEVGESKTYTDSTGAYTTATTEPNSTIATMTLAEVSTEGENTVEAMDTIATGDTFYIQVSDGVYRTANGGTTTELSEADLFTVGYAASYYCTIKNSSGNYLHANSGTITTSTNTGYMKMSNGQLVDYYYTSVVFGTPVKVTASDPVKSTAITFKGISEGTTTAVVGTTQYNITVTPYVIDDEINASGSSTWTVNAELQRQRYNSMIGLSKDSYTDESWTEYETARKAAYAKLGEVTAATYTSEAAAETALNELIAAVDALETKYKALASAKTISVRYQLNSSTIDTREYKVAADATTLTLPATIVVDNVAYTVDETELTLGVDTTVDVPVSKVGALGGGFVASTDIAAGTHENMTQTCDLVDDEGTARKITEMTLTTGYSYDLDLATDTTGYTVEWTTGDKNVATVDADGKVTATGIGTTTIVATVKDADGNVVEVNSIPVTVYQSASTDRISAIYIENIDNTTVYCVVNADTEKMAFEVIEGELIYGAFDTPVSDGSATTAFTFFGDPDEAHALVAMTSTNSFGDYYLLHDDNGNMGTGTEYYILPDGTTGAGYWQAIGLTDNAHDNKADWTLIKAMVQWAIDNGCDGGMGFTRRLEEGDIGTNLTFISDPMPKIEKTIDGVLPTSRKQADYRDYTEGMVAAVGELVYFKITVTLERPSAFLDDGVTGAITYSDAELSDTVLPGAYLYTKELDELDGAYDGEIDEAYRVQVEDITSDLNAAWAADETVRTRDYYLVYEIQESDIPKFWIDNIAYLNYNYESHYSTGAQAGAADAEARISVVGTAIDDVVIDFGQSFVYTGLTNIHLKGVYTGSEAKAFARYGTVTVEKAQRGTEVDDKGYPIYDYTVVYTPTTILQGVDTVLLYGIGDENQEKIINGFLVYPATTVYYEEGFMLNGEYTWNSDAAKRATGEQTFELLGKSVYDDNGMLVNKVTNQTNAYGYDPLYTQSGYTYGDSYASSATIGNTTTFTFTGTGFDLYANCTVETGRVSVQVRNSAGKLAKVYTVDTVVKGGETTATEGQTGDEFHLPIVSVDGLAHDTYTVSLVKIAETEPVKIDGVRIHNTVEDSSVFNIDLEDNPVFYELRDAVLNAVDVRKTASEMYGDDWMNDKSLIGPLAEQVYGALSTTDTVSAVVTSVSDIYSGDADAQDLLDNGPKNELFLYPSQTLTFKVTTSREMQIGLKAPRAATSYTLTYEVDNVTKAVATEKTLNTSVDMFYALGNPTGTSTEYTVSVINTGNDILSVTDLKICDDPNAAFVPLTVEDIEYILTQAGVGGQEPAPEEPIVPEEPEVPVIEYADAVLKINLVDYTGKQLAAAELTANGIKGEENAFAGAAVLRIAERNLPKGYALVSKQADAVKVAYGEEITVSVQIGKVATVKVTFVNLLGRKVGTATITKVQTSAAPCRITAAEIRSLAPVGRLVIRLTSVTAAFGSTTNVIVPVV